MKRCLTWHDEKLTTFALTVIVSLLGAFSVCEASSQRDVESARGLDVESARALVEYAEQQRIELFDRLAPAVVCIYDAMERGGGSGVLIDPSGIGLTNYHVVAGMLGTRRGLGGLSDGRLYDLEVLGIDPTGDVAMFRLLRRSEGETDGLAVAESSGASRSLRWSLPTLLPAVGEPANSKVGTAHATFFPFATLGDSDAVRIGDTAIAAGNPFTLSEDYTPTFTVGLVTGVHRYQYGVGNNLVYSDCIQTDAAINPGNSGGPLFNAAGEIIGINGRISVNTRGRYNVGHGYAISSNQIKRFMPALRAGLIGKHGTLEATVHNVAERGIMFNDVRPEGAAHRAGVRVGDRLLSFDDVAIRSPNHFASLLGTYPQHWTVRLGVERDGEPLTLTARLDPIEPKLNQPFTVQGEVNQREVVRVLTRYRRELLGLDDATGPSSLRWSGTRLVQAGGANTPGRTRQIQAVWERGSSALLVEHDASGVGGGEVPRVAVRRMEFDDQAVTFRFGDEGQPYEPPPDQRAVLHALYLAHIKLLQPVDSIGLEAFLHTGADASPLPDRNELDPWKRGMLELIETPLATGGAAEFGFDVMTGRLVRILLRDPVFGREITVLLHDYEVFGGGRFPTRIEVHAPDEMYVDQLDHWGREP